MIGFTVLAGAALAALVMVCAAGRVFATIVLGSLLIAALVMVWVSAEQRRMSYAVKSNRLTLPCVEAPSNG